MSIEARRLHVVHAERTHCREGCSACCADELGVFEVEAERIREAHPDLLAQGTPGPAGGCAFLDEHGACRIYEERPYVCRTQGLPLRWEDEEDGEPVEYRDICPLNEAGPPLAELPVDECWTLGAAETRLAQLDAAQGSPPRVTLRSLFARHG